MLNQVDTLPEVISSNRATFSPEDGKLRLYLAARVERDSYLYLRKIGYVATPKQDSSFVAPWSVEAEDAALAFIPEEQDIEDEDYSAADRSADRAERFGEYRDKRRSEAMGAAGSFSGMDSVAGNQNLARAQSYARRRDRIGSYAVSQWSKAEYWQERTAGVISSALYKLKPGVRRGRLKRLETDLRKAEKRKADAIAHWESWRKVASTPDVEEQRKAALQMSKSGSDWSFLEFKHPDNPEVKNTLWRMLNPLLNSELRALTGAEVAALALSRYPGNGPCGENSGTQRWINHLNLRINYERQMIEAEGGMAGEADMVIGGWIGNRQIWKINRSSTTGRVVSVGFLGSVKRYSDETAATKIVSVNIERLGEDVYRAPTESELKQFNEQRKRVEETTPGIKLAKLINPTVEEAKRLTAIWNKSLKLQMEKRNREFQPLLVHARTKEEVKGLRRKPETVYVTKDGHPSYRREEGIFRVRAIQTYSLIHYSAFSYQIVAITDSATSPMPLDWERLEGTKVDTEVEARLGLAPVEA